MNQVIAVVLAAVALVSLGVGAMFGLWMGAGDSDDTVDEPISVTVFIDYGDNSSAMVDIMTRNATVYGALLDAAKPEKGNFTVETTYYASFDSVLVDRIGHRTGGDDGKYWQFRVNGDYVNEGCDRARLGDGDLVEWSFEESNW